MSEKKSTDVLASQLSLFNIIMADSLILHREIFSSLSKSILKFERGYKSNVLWTFFLRVFINYVSFQYYSHRNVKNNFILFKNSGFNHTNKYTLLFILMSSNDSSKNSEILEVVHKILSMGFLKLSSQGIHKGVRTSKLKKNS